MSDVLARLHELSLLKDPSCSDIPAISSVTVQVAKNLIENDLNKLPFGLCLYPLLDDGGLSIQFNTECLCFEIEVVQNNIILFVFMYKYQLEQKFDIEQFKKLIPMNKEQFGEYVNGRNI